MSSKYRRQNTASCSRFNVGNQLMVSTIEVDTPTQSRRQKRDKKNPWPMRNVFCATIKCAMGSTKKPYTIELFVALTSFIVAIIFNLLGLFLIVNFTSSLYYTVFIYNLDTPSLICLSFV